MKRILIVVLAFVFCIPTCNALADGFNAVVENKSANPGEIVDINICLENNAGIIAALFNVEYDKERLELIQVQDGRLLDGGTFSPNYKAYPYKMVWNSASYTDFTEDGVLAVLRFKVSETAQPGKAFINLTYKDNDVFNVDLKNVSVNVINGWIDINDNTSSGERPVTGGGHKASGSGFKVNTQNAEKEEKRQIVLKIGEKKATVFGEIKENDVAPLIRNDRTMLPARFVAENLGASVAWDEANQRVTVSKDGTVIIITIDEQIAYVNDRAIVLDSPAFIENDRTYTPLRFIVENLGAYVEWNEAKQEVIITE